MRIISLAIGIVLISCFCRPSDDSYLRDTLANREGQGFITKDIYQLKCSYEHTDPYQKSSPANWREEMLSACREKAIIQFGDYRAHYELNEQALLQNQPEVPLHTRTIQWSEFQKAELKRIYSSLALGQIIYEKNEGLTTSIMYRIQYTDLILKIQDSEFPFQLP